jgi:hypothetical protein
MKTLFRISAMLLSLSACTGGAGNFVADGKAGPEFAKIATLTGSPLLDQAIRAGGDYEMLDAIYVEYVVGGSSIAKADAPKREAALHGTH